MNLIDDTMEIDVLEAKKTEKQKGKQRQRQERAKSGEYMTRCSVEAYYLHTGYFAMAVIGP